MYGCHHVRGTCLHTYAASLSTDCSPGSIMQNQADISGFCNPIKNAVWTVSHTRCGVGVKRCAGAGCVLSAAGDRPLQDCNGCMRGRFVKYMYGRCGVNAHRYRFPTRWMPQVMRLKGSSELISESAVLAFMMLHICHQGSDTFARSTEQPVGHD